MDAKLDKQNITSELFQAMANHDRIWLDDSVTSVHHPVLPKTFCSNGTIYPTDDFPYTVFVPEKINYDLEMCKDQYHVGHTDRFLMRLKSMVEGDIRKLERAGIPVFINDHTEPQMEDRCYSMHFVAHYSVPEELMYKSFFVLNEITPAVDKASEYAMQQVMKVLDKY